MDDEDYALALQLQADLDAQDAQSVNFNSNAGEEASIYYGLIGLVCEISIRH